MLLKFKYQQFQADAARAVCDVFRGQPNVQPSFLMDPDACPTYNLPGTYTGRGNAPLAPELTREVILARLNKIQLAGGLKPSQRLEPSPSCDLNLTVEMETGVGKTYTYIKTMYELHKAYGWSKFIVIVPSVAIREGVNKTFAITSDHFAAEYGRKIRFFIYNSGNPEQIRTFATDPGINVMIINNQAFNARGKKANLIYQEQDRFGSMAPMSMLAQTRPILIIDEPQSVEGAVTREKLREFQPMITLRYSATHRENSIYNMVYRLDALDAIKQNLVKKIKVKGFDIQGSGGHNGYIFLQSVDVSKGNPAATISFDYRKKSGVTRKTRKVRVGDNLFDQSDGLEEYKNNYVVTVIDGRDNHIEFANGLKLHVGQAEGQPDEEQLRRLQIRETILSHFEREEANFALGIKTLSLFFIDAVDKYRLYDKEGNKANGLYAQMFEEEYESALNERLGRLPVNHAYRQWLQSRPAKTAHAGYFSIDKKGGKSRFVDSREIRAENGSDDVDTFDLIMKDRERLLDLDEPVRFIFSHSALREGWDNPNVFQICALKNPDEGKKSKNGSSIRKRQEVGRGLRLCVNSQGERMDGDRIGGLAAELNVLTVIASGGYKDFAAGLQKEYVDAIGTRPRAVDKQLFIDSVLHDRDGNSKKIDGRFAGRICHDLIVKEYVDRDGALTEKYWNDKKNGVLDFCADAAPYAEGIIKILDTVYNPDELLPRDARQENVRQEVSLVKKDSEAFKKLWAQINAKSAYKVVFDENELIGNSVKALAGNLKIGDATVTVTTGSLDNANSKDDFKAEKAFKVVDTETHTLSPAGSGMVKYDLLGKLVEETGLTRLAIAKILTAIPEDVFNQFRKNPEDFILRAAAIINAEKADLVIQHITYNKIDSRYTEDIFTGHGLRGRLGKNAIRTDRHLYDYLVYDSDTERRFAEELESRKTEVELYIKLPKNFYISTPMGKYNPDWAISFYEGAVRHVYFVAETKGSLESCELRKIEDVKIDCARRHFAAISSDRVKYGVVTSYGDLLKLIS